MNLALVLIHNKSDQENFDQIEALKPFITKITDTQDELDDQGNIIGTFDTYHYELQGLDFPHELKIYQILPYQPNNPRLQQGFPYEGVWPVNSYDIDSYKVAYGKGDEDKTGDHPRFFNWGLKRGTDYGAEIVIYLEDHGKLDISALKTQIKKLDDKNDPAEFAENDAAKITTLKMLEEVGQLDEVKTKEEALTEYKEKIVDKGNDVIIEVKGVING